MDGKKIVLAMILGLVGCQQAMPQIGGAWADAEPNVNASQVKYVLVMEVREIVSGRSNAMICPPVNPDCNTLYAFTQKMIPFNNLKEVRDYLGSTSNKFVKLFALSEITVTVKETETTIPQPPVTQKKKTYSIQEPKP